MKSDTNNILSHVITIQLQQILEPEELNDFIKKFEHNSTQQLQILQQSIAQQDFETICKTAHALKGSSGSVGAEKLSLLASNLEKIAQQQSAAPMPNLLNDITSTLQASLIELKKL